jgi:hypothetical protein
MDQTKYTTMNPYLRKTLHWLSIFSGFTMIFGFCMFILMLILSQVPGINSITVGGISLVLVIATCISLILIAFFCKFESPYY